MPESVRCNRYSFRSCPLRSGDNDHAGSNYRLPFVDLMQYVQHHANEQDREAGQYLTGLALKESPHVLRHCYAFLAAAATACTAGAMARRSATVCASS